MGGKSFVLYFWFFLWSVVFYGLDITIIRDHSCRIKG